MEFGNTLGAFYFLSCAEVLIFLCSILFVLPISWQYFRSKGKSHSFIRALLTTISTFIGLSVLTFLGLLFMLSPNWPWSKPSTSSIVGTWQLSTFTANFLEREDGITIPPHSLIFRSDGSFYMDNMLNIYEPLDSLDPNENMFINASGRWMMAKSDYGQWQIHIEFLNSSNPNLEGVKDHILMERRFPPYELLMITESNHYIFRLNKNWFSK